jgi:hypothetical protein
MTGRPFACQGVADSRRTSHLIAMAKSDKQHEERLAAALRENLRRRKAQARKIQEDKPDAPD